MIIKLSASEVAGDDNEAMRDHNRATQKGWHCTGYQPGGGLDARLRFRILAYRAERAAAVWFGMADWRRDPNGFGKADIGGFSIRLGSERGYGLVVRLSRDKPNIPYLLMERCLDDFCFRPVGILPAGKAMMLKAEGVGRSVPGTGDPWLIPQSNLKAFA